MFLHCLPFEGVPGLSGTVVKPRGRLNSFIRGPTGHLNIRILQIMVSGIPLQLAFEPHCIIVWGPQSSGPIVSQIHEPYLPGMESEASPWLALFYEQKTLAWATWALASAFWATINTMDGRAISSVDIGVYIAALKWAWPASVRPSLDSDASSSTLTGGDCWWLWVEIRIPRSQGSPMSPFVEGCDIL